MLGALSSTNEREKKQIEILWVIDSNTISETKSIEIQWKWYTMHGLIRNYIDRHVLISNANIFPLVFLFHFETIKQVGDSELLHLMHIILVVIYVNDNICKIDPQIAPHTEYGLKIEWNAMLMLL